MPKKYLLKKWLSRSGNLPANRRPNKPFITDGCSGWMSLIADSLNIILPWEGACRDHDKTYWQGGSWQTRLLADQLLRRKVASAGYPRVASMMYYATRLFGAPYSPLPWRWGLWLFLPPFFLCYKKLLPTNKGRKGEKVIYLALKKR